MTDDLQKAYQAYQNALSNLPNPRDPNLWYGIGLLYDRYGSLDNALEAFLAVLSISPDFERADEVCFCIGIIYKEQQKFDEALKYFNRVVVASNPPPPLTRADGWYQIGHVHELKRDINSAIEMYKQALKENPQHPKTLQNYGWLEHSHNSNAAEAIHLLRRSAEYEPNDGQTWYLLGRVYMSLREFRQAYDAYQQAVYRDCSNATFWCSIGVLYYQMNQRRDAMDAYTRAIGLNPYVSEVWYDLGTLYESCDQSSDAIDAYRQAAKLAPDNAQITARLRVLEANIANQQTHPTSQQPAITQPQPVQMQPDMQNATQGHVNPLLNRSIGPSVHHMRDPLPQQKLAQHQPLMQPPQRHLRQVPPQQPAVNAAQGPVSMQGVHERTGAVDMAPIPSMRPPTMAAAPPNGYAPHQRTAVPASIPTPVQHAPHPMTSVTQHLSQPLSSQQHPAHMPVSAPPHIPRQQYAVPMHTSAPAPHAQLKPLAHQGLPQESHLQPHMQQTHLQLPRLAPPSSQGRLPPEAQHPASAHGAPRLQQPPSGMPVREPQPQPPPQPRPQPTAHVNGTSETRSLPQQPATLSQMQPLPQMQQLPPIQQARATPIERPQRKGPDHHSPDSAERQRRSNATEDPKNRVRGSDDGSRSRFGLSDQLQAAEDVNEKSHPLKVSQLNNHPTTQLPSATRQSPRRLYASPQEREQRTGEGRESSSPMPGAPRDRSESVDDKMNDKVLSKHVAKPVESGADSLHRMSDSVQRERDHRTDSSGQNGHAMPGRSTSSDRLSPVKQTGATSSQEDNSQAKGDETKATYSPSPSLPKPTPGSLPPLSEVGNGKHLPPTSAPGTLSMGAGSNGVTRTPSLPLLSTRAPSTLGGGSLQAAKDPASAGLGLTSSLTKFSKRIAHAPTTPVNSSVAPSSLPSPLPTRKTPGSGMGMHGHRSPRPSKQNHVPSFKSIPIPPPSYGAQIDSVPSPSSLPVLPALPSRAIHSNDAKSTTEKERRRTSNDEGKSGADDENTHPRGASSPKRSGDGGSRRTAEHSHGSKSVYGMLRSSPAPKGEQEGTGGKGFKAKEDRMRSPSAPPFERHGERMRSPSVPALGRKDGSSSSKREGTSREDSLRTAKRPRLHESEMDVSDEKSSRQRTNNEQRIEDKRKVDIPSLREIKPGQEEESARVKEGKSGDEDDAGKQSLSSPIVNLPRLSNPISKLSGPPSLPANTPLPSFRSERMSLSASRSANGSAPSAKQSTQDGNRGSLSFALRSAPVSAQARKASGTSSTRSGGDKADYQDGSRDTDSRDVDERMEAAQNRKSPRDDTRVERLANGEGMKGKASAGALDVISASELGKKEEKANRAEIRSSAT
ncbi:TPR repeat containing protein [Gracilaria domingensis]|nr:TPR repeat containing protein [Gracilaria domingensis]